MRQQDKKISVKPGKLRKRENMMGYIFILPWLIGFLLLVVYPICESFIYSLNTIKLLPQGMVKKFIGFGNYTQMFLKDPNFVMGLESYLLKTIISVPVIVAFALIIAMLLNGKIKCRGIFRMIFFLPVIIASGPVMNQLADQKAATVPMLNTTTINQVLSEYLPKVLASSVTDVFGNMITLLWYSGIQILLFLAALQKIDSTLYEAAKIDGGSGWECFWKITLPTIKPIILLNAVYTIIFMSNNEQNALIVLIYDTMLSATGGYGYASAMAWCYSIIITAIVGLFALIIAGRKDVYERRVKKYMREVKKQERLQRRIRRRGKRNEKRYRRKYAS
ncbi:MAG: sugar ABC transporter permease [Lachnospiraceae bacterium]|nr:sugar ABC transporter permease [Lachnospiraceae bacterium]MEE0959906.1 sugar ABC transporter permease [Lachnospiraceae bacterium]